MIPRYRKRSMPQDPKHAFHGLAIAHRGQRMALPQQYRDSGVAAQTEKPFQKKPSCSSICSLRRVT
jgi:hypothetical protein